MHSLLEKYLSEVAKHLQPLPIARRNEELYEIHQHLLHAVTVNRETGLSEDEAVLTTLNQFGEPIDLGQNLLMTWQREEARLNKRSYCGAAICVIVSLWAGQMLLVLLTRVNLHPDFQHMRSTEEMSEAQRALNWIGIAGFAMVIFAGFISGLTFPRKAVQGTCAGMALFYALVLCWQVFRDIHAGTDSLHIHDNAMMVVLNGLAFSLLAMLGAWASRKWRATPTRLMCDDQ